MVRQYNVKVSVNFGRHLPKEERNIQVPARTKQEARELVAKLLPQNVAIERVTF